MKRCMPDSANGSVQADIFVGLGIELGMTHLLIPDAIPSQDIIVVLPDRAPELYQKRRDKSEKPPEFIARVYKRWLGLCLAKHHLLHLDKPLYMALANWLKKNELPDWLDLPTKKEIIDRELAQIGVNHGDTLPYPTYYKGLKDKLRLYNAARNRKSE